MDLKILYEPYILCLLLAVIISIFYYFNEKSNYEKSVKLSNKKGEDVEENNILPKTIISLLASYMLMLMGFYCYKYFNVDTLISQSGGGSVLKNKNDVNEAKRDKIMERLTIVDDDIDVGILED
jgi:hypothetical protein